MAVETHRGGHPRVAGRRTTLRLTPEVERAVELVRERHGAASDQEALAQLLRLGAQRLEAELALERIARERHEAYDREELERYGPQPAEEDMAGWPEEFWREWEEASATFRSDPAEKD